MEKLKIGPTGMEQKTFVTRNILAANIVLATGGLNTFVSKDVQNSTSVLLLKFSAKNPAHRKSANRYRAF